MRLFRTRVICFSSLLTIGLAMSRCPCEAGNPTTAAEAFPDVAFETVSNDLSHSRVRPNPWRSDQHSGNPVTFDQITAGSTVKIFTVSGHWVKTLDSPNGTAAWDLTTNSGEKVASGIYLYLITDGQGNKAHGKFAVIQ